MAPSSWRRSGTSTAMASSGSTVARNVTGSFTCGAIRATLLVLDPKNMFRWVQIQAQLHDTTFDGADDHIERLSRRYFGRPYANPKVDRLIIRLEPLRVTGMDSGQPWDVTA